MVMGSISGLRDVAKYQRNINLCILATIALITVTMLLGTGGIDAARSVVVVLYYGVQFTALYYVFMLARALYGTGLAVLLGLLLFAPCVNLLVLLIVNQRATWLLRKAGVKVGLLGADPNRVPADGRTLSELVKTFR